MVDRIASPRTRCDLAEDDVIAFQFRAIHERGSHRYDVVSMLFKGDSRTRRYRVHINGRLLGVSFMTMVERFELLSAAG